MPLAFFTTWAHAGSFSVAVDQHPQVVFCLAPFKALISHPEALNRVVVTQGLDLALGLVEPYTVIVSSTILSVQTPLLPTLQQIITPTQLGVICELTEGALNAPSRSSLKTLNRIGPNIEPWGNPLLTGCQLDVTPFTTWPGHPASILPSEKHTHPHHEVLPSPTD
ncbi:hypothetical protein WISP_94045 [Willisornis vidua]|uniref:Uncharacterized protein n=1 Tax=Willisornis vidua TaxID=1566151 RepID=A0ABQ9D0T5_9PASS|nr:hypothetical protein WISP_94045 [Willisornis vidua]